MTNRISDYCDDTTEPAASWRDWLNVGKLAVLVIVFAGMIAAGVRFGWELAGGR